MTKKFDSATHWLIIEAERNGIAVSKEISLKTILDVPSSRFGEYWRGVLKEIETMLLAKEAAREHDTGEMK